MEEEGEDAGEVEEEDGVDGKEAVWMVVGMVAVGRGSVAERTSQQHLHAIECFEIH